MLAALLAGVLLAAPSPAIALATDEPAGYRAGSVVLVPEGDTTLSLAERRYPGRLRITGHSDGLAVVEEATLDDYLLGIREVPFSWPREALRAQVVAARTYLAWTLFAGRSSNGRRYDYDICATEACQVYAGIGAVLGGGDGERWRAAVSSTAGQILMAGGRPAQALYSSTSGGRTRSVEDVFAGSDPVPYLRAVASPGERSPFVSWSFAVPEERMAALLEAAGLASGAVRTVTTVVRGDGEGPWQVVVESDGGTTSVDTWRFRTLFNRAAADLVPEQLPVLRPDGSLRRYPQTVMSPTFVVRSELAPVPGVEGPPTFERVFRIDGRGWGHLVGMSQFGAEAMARSGASAAEILGHYYSGLVPTQAGALLPETVEVGLVVGGAEAAVRPDGPVTVLVDGAPVAEAVLGTWRFASEGGAVRVLPPVGLGEPPRLTGWSLASGSGGEAVTVTLTAPAEVRTLAYSGRLLVFDSGWELRDAGVIAWTWRELAVGVAPHRRLLVIAEARSPQGEDASSLLFVPGLE